MLFFAPLREILFYFSHSRNKRVCFTKCSQYNGQVHSLAFEIESVEFEEIAHVKQPFLAIVKLRGAVVHWIVVEKTLDKKVKIFDPIWGESYLRYEKLEKIWLARNIVRR